MPSRKVTFKMYPNAAQTPALEATLRAHCQVHNALLETSKLRYKAGLPAYNRASACQDVQRIRNAHAAIKAHTLANSLQVNARLGAAYTRMRRLHAKVRNQRNDFYEKLTTWMAQTFGHIITEELNVSSMLTDESKGSGLKRGISDAAWATGLLDKISRKAEEAGGKFEMVPTRQVKPTRRCNGCGLVKTKEEMPMSQRLYVCAGCGFTLPRDQNACRNMARFSFEGAWWPKDKGVGTSPETPSKLV